MNGRLIVSLSPHVRSGASISREMWNVVLALFPALGVALWTFGTDALWMVCVCVLSCVACEWLIGKVMGLRKTTVFDGSAVITGMLLAFNLPSVLPLWMAVAGSVVAIGIAKMSFGGLGRNIWNPALVGRVFLLLSFPAAMTTWSPEVSSGIVEQVATGASGHADASTGATFLASLKAAGGAMDLSAAELLDMSVGQMNGSLGETGAIAILVGLAWLLLTRTITWHIPVSVIGSAALFSWLFGGNPLLDILAGGLLLGAVFMATDYVTSPMTGRGQLIYGAFIGLITIIIRRWGAYPEGVSFAILLMNSFTPLINRYCRPRVFGERRAAA